MCMCCCICNCCNSYSSKCVEICILILSSITFICSVLGFVCIKWSHLTTICSILLIIIIIFSTFIITSCICINIFRFKGKINNNRNVFSTYLALVCIMLTILIFLISFIAESLIQANFKDIDYPCKDISINNDPNVIIFRSLSLELSTREQKKQFCKDKNNNYYANLCSSLEYYMSYMTSAIIEICSLLLCFFWYNDYRRIKEKIDGELPIYDNAYMSKANFLGYNFKEGNESAAPSNRNCNRNDFAQSNIVFIKNKNDNSQKGINNKNDSANNFIRNLRKEMEEGMYSMDESSENKENEINLENGINKEFENNKENSNKNNDDLYSNKSNNDKNNNIIIIDNEDSKNETQEPNIEQKVISIFNDNNNNEIEPNNK